jgi:hypothetical protein
VRCCSYVAEIVKGSAVLAAAETVVAAAETVVVAAAAVDQSQSILLQGSSAVAGFDRTADKRQASIERKKKSSKPLRKKPLTPLSLIGKEGKMLYYRCESITRLDVYHVSFRYLLVDTIHLSTKWLRGNCYQSAVPYINEFTGTGLYGNFLGRIRKAFQTGARTIVPYPIPYKINWILGRKKKYFVRIRIQISIISKILGTVDTSVADP